MRKIFRVEYVVYKDNTLRKVIVDNLTKKEALFEYIAIIKGKYNACDLTIYKENRNITLEINKWLESERVN